MAAPKGNQFWKVRSSHGPKPKFKTPDDLWAACVEYFEWVDENPLIEHKAFHASGIITKTELPKLRAMTIGGLSIFLDVDETMWRRWRTKRKDLVPIIKTVEKIIYEQKFAGASADLLNSNIIARDLGLTEKTHNIHEIEDKRLSEMMDEADK